MVSGIPLSLNLVIADQYNKTLTIENSATATFRVNTKTKGSLIILSGTQAVANMGFLNFTGFGILAQPDTNFTLELIVNSITNSKTLNYIIPVSVRKCLSGE